MHRNSGIVGDSIQGNGNRASKTNSPCYRTRIILGTITATLEGGRNLDDQI